MSQYELTPPLKPLSLLHYCILDLAWSDWGKPGENASPRPSMFRKQNNSTTAMNPCFLAG
jgi:hypothetical protein